MKEIHAYQNDDGTYSVEVFGVEFIDTEFVREAKEYKMEIPRAQISITGLPPSDEDKNEYFTVTIE
jgi:hypothetical protein